MTITPRTRRGTTLAAALFSATLAFAACSGTPGQTPTQGGSATNAPSAATETTSATSEAPSTTRKVEAANGTIEIPANPQRIVTIGNTDIPFIDLGGKPVGVTEVSESDLAVMSADQRAAYEAAEVIGTSGGEVDLEKLAALEPDLILVQFHADDWAKVGTQLETVAPTVLWGLDTEWKEFADAIAEAGNLTDSLSAQKTAFETKVAKIKETYGEIIDGSSFVDISRGSWNDPGTFYIADIGCSEIARDDIGLNLPEAPEGEDPLAYESLPFEQLTSLSTYDVITYPVDAAGQPTEAFTPVIEANTWKALPAVDEGRALGVFCPGNNSYGTVLQYLDSLDAALATLPAKE